MSFIMFSTLGFATSFNNLLQTVGLVYPIICSSMNWFRESGHWSLNVWLFILLWICVTYSDIWWEKTLRPSFSKQVNTIFHKFRLIFLLDFWRFWWFQTQFQTKRDFHKSYVYISFWILEVHMCICGHYINGTPARDWDFADLLRLSYWLETEVYMFMYSEHSSSVHFSLPKISYTIHCSLHPGDYRKW